PPTPPPPNTHPFPYTTLFRSKGTRSITGSPRGLRPRRRTMLVLSEVSSMNTKRAGSSKPCSRIQRRRAWATSARSRSAACRLFFIGDVMAKEKPRERALAGLDPPLAQFSHCLHQSSVWFLRTQRQYLGRVLLQGGNAPAAQLRRRAPSLTPGLKPSHRRTRTDIEPFGRLVPRRARFYRFDHAYPQVTRVGPRHRISPKKGI